MPACTSYHFDQPSQKDNIRPWMPSFIIQTITGLHTKISNGYNFNINCIVYTLMHHSKYVHILQGHLQY